MKISSTHLLSVLFVFVVESQLSSGRVCVDERVLLESPVVSQRVRLDRWLLVFASLQGGQISAGSLVALERLARSILLMRSRLAIRRAQPVAAAAAAAAAHVHVRAVLLAQRRQRLVFVERAGRARQRPRHGGLVVADVLGERVVVRIEVVQASVAVVRSLLRHVLVQSQVDIHVYVVLVAQRVRIDRYAYLARCALRQPVGVHGHAVELIVHLIVLVVVVLDRIQMWRRFLWAGTLI
jgi:hypothetical protein